MKALQRKIRTLYVANEALPENDYRVNYLFSSQVSEVYFAMPGRTSIIPEDRYFVIGVGEGFQPAYLRELGRLLVLLIKHKGKFDVVHFYSTILTLVGPIITKFVGIPAFITITGFGRTFSSKDLKYRLLRPLYKLLFIKSLVTSEAILFQNFYDMGILCQNYPKFCHKFFYAGSAVELEAVKADEKDFLCTKLKVLLVARLNYDKGIQDYLAVAKQLHGVKFEFTLVGPKTLGDDALFEKVNQYSEMEVINYLGELDISGIISLFSSHHVFFFPSYAEGMPRVMLEAGYGCLCPIAYDIPANRDLVLKTNGYLVPINDIDSVVTILNNLYEDRQLLKEKAINYQQHIVYNFNMNQFTKRLDGLYSRLMVIK